MKCDNFLEKIDIACNRRGISTDTKAVFTKWKEKLCLAVQVTVYGGAGGNYEEE